MAAANLVSSAAAKRYSAVPVAFRDERTILVAMADPGDVLAIDDLAIMTGLDVQPAVASREDLHALVSRLTRLDDVITETDGAGLDLAQTQAEVVDLRAAHDDAPVMRLANQVIAQAVEQGASDIHLEPEADSLRVRFRVDGVLLQATTVPRHLVGGLVSRVKVMAELDIAERRLPQDGRVALTIDGHSVDLRVVTLPCVHGEGVVMRILDRQSVPLELAALGLPERERLRFEAAVHQPHGAVLVTGPTGSGKSTTLYATLAALASPEKNAITIEDPVEFRLPGVTQVQVNRKAGLDFATGLKAMMRADPDVIMVGEVRDRQTAQIAVEAALTGHLVLSTLHTNDAPGAITRLVDMGVEPFLVASAVRCVVAQRLARTLCAHCRRPTVLCAGTLRASGFAADDDVEAFEAGGCPRCHGSGYRGRIGLYEVMEVGEELRALTVERAPGDRLADAALRAGMRRLRDDGLAKVIAGQTSIAEVTRVTGS